MMASNQFEVTLVRVTECGDLVFDHRGEVEQLLACQGTVGNSPFTPDSLQKWKEVEGTTGTLVLAWYRTLSEPALFSYTPYADQSQRRVYRLDDAGEKVNVVGWRNFNNPAGYLAPVSLPGRGV